MNDRFKFFLTLFVFCSIGLGLFSARAFALEHVGIVKNLSGDVQIQRNNAFIPVFPGLKLMDADILITGARGGQVLFLQMEQPLPLGRTHYLTSKVIGLNRMLRSMILQCTLKKVRHFTPQEKLESYPLGRSRYLPQGLQWVSGVHDLL